MDDQTRKILLDVGRSRGTPCYVYFVDAVRDRFDQLNKAFGSRFTVSYAVKANPNVPLLKRLRDKATLLDVSSIAELERARQAGYAPQNLTFSGPAKRLYELERAVQLGVGQVVCESQWEMEQLNRLAAEACQRVSMLVRINPSQVPARMGHNLAGRPSQFGIDQEDVDGVLAKLGRWAHLICDGLHVYSATNCLSEEAIAENFSILIDLFTRFSRSHDLRPKKLIFGSGFGIAYLNGQQPIDLAKLAAMINPQIDRMRRCHFFTDALCVLEMGRWLVGPDGYLLTSVLNEKHSRGTEIRMCDAGFNNHLAACGKLGAVTRGNWRFSKVNAVANEPIEQYLLVGPLCAADDQLAVGIQLPRLARGDLLAISCSGAYGLTFSPTSFIGHPVPREYLIVGSATNTQILDVSEACVNGP